MTMMPRVVAGGGVVYRRRKGGKVEYLVVHRPRYRDWTHPKGKVDGNESLLEAAIREVKEETGYTCAIHADLGSIGYMTSNDNRKVVRYWLMEQENGKFFPNSEVDQAKWLTRTKAGHLLSYARDREVLSWAARRVEGRRFGRIYLTRHARAGNRQTWKKDDRLRPLSKKGRRQAVEAVEAISAFPIGRILTSPYLRCIETIEPLASALDIEPEVEPRLGDDHKPKELREVMEELRGDAALLCGHRSTIEPIIKKALSSGAKLDTEAKWEKGSTWVLNTRRGRITGGLYLPPSARRYD